MLFSEVYGTYYRILGKLLTQAVEGSLTRQSLEDTVREYGFEETALTLPEALKNGTWPLLKADLTTPVKHPPATPLTLLQKQWLKTLLQDPRIRLFDPPAEGLEDVESLYDADSIVYFDRYSDGSPTRFFDFKNHPRGGGGTTGEWRVSYRVSDQIPLSILVACRTFSRDGYYVSIADGGYVDVSNMPVLTGVALKRAYSTYIELGYDFDLTQNWLLAARVGVTPWKSLYTGFQGNFAVTMTQLKLTKTWEIRREARGANVTAFANLMLQPWQLNKDNLILPIGEAGDQKLNMAVGCTVALGN